MTDLPTSPQTIQVSRAGEIHEATVSWRYEGDCDYVVEISSAVFEPVTARAADAFEGLCLVREQLEPHGWRIGVVGAQLGVWPSGMARDQGGGLVAYRITDAGAQAYANTFEPADPETVTTVDRQRAEYMRIIGAHERKNPTT